MKKTIIVLSIVAVLGVGGYLFYKSQIDKLYGMDYGFESVRFENIAFDNTVIDLKLRVTSDSTLEAEISDLDLDAYINGVKVGKIVDNRKIIIPAKGYSIVDIKVSINMDEVRMNGIAVLGDIWKNKDANLTLKGSAKVKTAFIKVPTKIDYTESIKYLMS